MFDELFSEFRDTIKKQETKELELITENRCPDSLRVLVDRNKLTLLKEAGFSNVDTFINQISP
jgi:hypothetical protein